MATLSLDFEVTLNAVTKKLIITDTSTYPSGVAAGVTGIINALQPDRIQREGDFDAPDVSIGNGTGEIELRLNTDGTIQEGNYSVTFKVRHASYDESTLTKSFRIAYKRPTISIVEEFDVFTPSLQLADGTEYIRGGWSAPTKTRAWDVTVGSAGTVTGNGQALDLHIGGEYYDAEYSGTLEVVMEYASSIYSYLTLIDKGTASYEGTANTPPSYTVLKSYLKQIKEAFDSLTSCRKSTDARQDFEYASSLLQFIKSRLCSGDTVGLQNQIDEFLSIYYNRVSPVYVNTNQVIPAYSLDDVDCGGGSGGTAPRSYTYTAAGGETSFTASALANKTIIAVISSRAIPMTVVTTGTPDSDQVKYTATSGKVEVNASYPFDAGEKMGIIYV